MWVEALEEIGGEEGICAFDCEGDLGDEPAVDVWAEEGEDLCAAENVEVALQIFVEGEDGLFVAHPQNRFAGLCVGAACEDDVEAVGERLFE